MAARFLGGGEFHHFDTCAVGVVSIQTVFSVAANLGTVKRLQSVLAQLGRGSLGIFHAEREMVLHAEFLVVALAGILSMYSSVVAIGDLDFVPVGVLILEAAVPVETKSKNDAVKFVFLDAVADDKPGMKYF